MSIRWSLVCSALLIASSAVAQGQGARTDCDDNGGGWRRRSVHVCEVRELNLPAAKTLAVDAQPNGGIRVSGEERRDVHVRARVDAWADDEADAKEILSEVEIRTDGTLRADGPDRVRRAGWSVSYEILTPRAIDLSLETQNGGIEVADVSGELELETLNGGLKVDGVGGNVRGRTTNGGVEATLTGGAWDGDGLDLRTTNGGVRLHVPEDYSARLETSTVNGGVDFDFPVKVQGRLDREISTTLGQGGAPVRVATTNGGVRVTR